MVANILIAASFFTIGFFVGGIITLSSCWNIMKKNSKDIRKLHDEKTIIVRVHGAEI